MITLQKKLYESLLDNEDDLITSNNEFRQYIDEFLKSKTFLDGISLTSCYLDDRLEKGGMVTICPCSVTKSDVPFNHRNSIKIIDEIPKSCIAKEVGYGKYYNGSVNIEGHIRNWPQLLKIGPVFSTTVYSKELINQDSIPEYSVLFSSVSLNVLSGMNINCRIFTATFDDIPQQTITIGIKGNPKRISTVQIRGRKLKNWSQLKNIKSDTQTLIIATSELAENIIKTYKSNLSAESNTCLFNQTNDFKDILKNFKNLNNITLDVKYSMYKNRDNTWEIFYNYI